MGLIRMRLRPHFRPIVLTVLPTLIVFIFLEADSQTPR